MLSLSLFCQSYACLSSKYRCSHLYGNATQGTSSKCFPSTLRTFCFLFLFWSITTPITKLPITNTLANTFPPLGGCYGSLPTLSLVTLCFGLSTPTPSHFCLHCLPPHSILETGMDGQLHHSNQAPHTATILLL